MRGPQPKKEKNSEAWILDLYWILDPKLSTDAGALDVKREAISLLERMVQVGGADVLARRYFYFLFFLI